MHKIYNDLVQLLADFEKDRNTVQDNQDLLLGYADDFYEMLSRLRDKLTGFLYE